METFEALRDQVSKITIYDIKSVYNQAKNMVLNVSEMEAKVQEATNDEPWGASSTLMQEIAQGTFNFQQFNEIMPAIYTRFMDKEAREWRQIYKALQLLEYIIKHGSERVIDDARSHLSTLKMLRNFHYVDDKGKDQGINVRQRSKEIVELLSDLEKVRQERRKAKANRNKYIGTGNDSMNFSSGGRYGGFGSDSLDYGGNSGYGGSSGGFSGGFRDSSRKQDFEEYDAGDWEDTTRGSATASQPAGGSGSSRTTATTKPAAKPELKAPQPPKVQNLLDFDDDSWGSPASAPAPTGTAPPAAVPKPAASNDFDDFDDFQSAPSATTTAPAPAPLLIATAAPAPAPTSKPAANVFDLLNATPAAPSPATSAARPPMGYGMGSGITPSPAPTYAPMKPATPATPAAATPAKTTSGGGFDDLWSLSLGGSKPSTPAAGSTAGKTIQDLQREKASQAFWSAGTGAHKPGSASIGGGQFAAPSGADDFLL